MNTLIWLQCWVAFSPFLYFSNPTQKLNKAMAIPSSFSSEIGRHPHLPPKNNHHQRPVRNKKPTHDRSKPKQQINNKEKKLLVSKIICTWAAHSKFYLFNKQNHFPIAASIQSHKTWVWSPRAQLHIHLFKQQCQAPVLPSLQPTAVIHTLCQPFHWTTVTDKP